MEVNKLTREEIEEFLKELTEELRGFLTGYVIAYQPVDGAIRWSYRRAGAHVYAKIGITPGTSLRIFIDEGRVALLRWGSKLEIRGSSILINDRDVLAIIARKHGIKEVEIRGVNLIIKEIRNNLVIRKLVIRLRIPSQQPSG